MDNATMFVGNLVRDPELRFTPSGQAVVNTGVAVNRRYQSNNQWVEETSFFDLVVWGTLAENVAACLNKGDRVVVTGRMQQRSWETDGGDKRSKVELVVDGMGPDLRWATATVEKNERREGQGSGSPPQQKQAPAVNPYASGEEPF